MSTEAEVSVVEHDHAHHEHHDREIIVSVMVLDPRSHKGHLTLTNHSSLMQILRQGAAHLHTELLPPAADVPLDRLHNIHHHGAVGPAITVLEQSLGEFLRNSEHTPEFGIELVLAFHVNTRWAVAPKSPLTPREILALPAIGLDFNQFTLYAEGSNESLPLDTPIAITRGLGLEAQCDGKYGAA